MKRQWLILVAFTVLATGKTLAEGEKIDEGVYDTLSEDERMNCEFVEPVEETEEGEESMHNLAGEQNAEVVDENVENQP